MKSGLLRLSPVLIFMILGGVTVLVSQGQARHRSSLLARHTEDVCLQASRRLELYVDSRLSVAEIFARRWATHETRDFSQERFEEFGSVVVETLPGYWGMGLVSPDGSSSWSVTPNGDLLTAAVTDEISAVFEEVRHGDETVLTPPIKQRGRPTALFAALPLRRDEEFLGYLGVQFQVETLINDCFDERIRRDFAFLIRDGERTIYSLTDDGGVLDPETAPIKSERQLSVRNRVWHLTMVPRESPAGTGWNTALPIVLFGVFLSLGIASLVHLLNRRTEASRMARDRAIEEMSAREEAQRALADSESRYRGVFDSASEGIMIMDTSGTIIDANTASNSMHGYNKGLLTGTEYPDLISSKYQHLWTRFSEQLAASGSVRLDSKHRTYEGGEIDVEVRGTAFTYGGEPRLLVILTDVTERSRSERRHVMLSRKILVAQEEERGRIARELHDELGQLLTALRFELGWLQKKAMASMEDGASTFQGSMELVEKAAEEIRNICKGLRPPLLDDLGLEPAAEQLVEEFRERSGLTVDLLVNLDESEASISLELALCTYRVLQESLTNVGRHAKASEVSVTLVRNLTHLHLSVYDNGRGLETNQLRVMEGVGITGMRERASVVGGVLEIRSSPFQGTRVELKVPLGGETKEGGHDSYPRS